jgi:beta-1,4-mannosyltransferase
MPTHTKTSDKVLMLPKNHEYIKQLTDHLQLRGVESQCLKPFHWATPENVLQMIICSRKGYGLIHVHWLYVFPLFGIMKAFWVLCKVLGYKLVWEMHNILPHGYVESDKKIARWFHDHVDGIIYHSRTDIDKARKALALRRWKPHIIVPHGNFNESYENTVTKSEARRRLRLPERGKVVLCFGFIRENRGYDILLQATENLLDVDVVIAGKMEHVQVFKDIKAAKRNRKNLHLFEGWIADNEIQLYFNACDIVVLPYTEITTSGVIPLSYAFARPVIVSNIGGMRDVVDESTGILVEPGNPTDLRNAIDVMFKQKNIDEMGKAAQAFALDNFDWNKISKTIKRFYKDTVNMK